MFHTRVSENEAACEPLCFTLGRDHDGHWVVQEAHGLCGGVFTSENAATRYAKFESAGRGSIIRVLPDPIELNCLSVDSPRRRARDAPAHDDAKATTVPIYENWALLSGATSGA